MMQPQAHSLQFLRKRRFFLVLPLLVLPFTTLLFWALGGGKGDNAQAGQPTTKGSFNMQLPDAYLKDDKSLTKLSYYEKAASDSQKHDEELKNDPNYVKPNGTDTARFNKEGDTGIFSMKYNQSALRKGLNTSPYDHSDYADSNEAMVYKKLNELNTALNQATMQSTKTKGYSGVGPSSNVSLSSADIDRLEQMMDRSRNANNSDDPEMKQLNALMDKVLDIQHPERVTKKLEQKSQTTTSNIYNVKANGDENNTLLLSSDNIPPSQALSKNDGVANGFFSLVDDMENTIANANTIQAVIHETQTVVDGAIVKLRLTSDIVVNGTLVPKGSFVFGTASLNGERLNITINTIRYKSSLFPVQLAVVDMDGMEGVYVPGAITRDVAKNATDRAVQSIGMPTLETSLGAQATSAGIEAAKTLLSRKAKLVKVTLKAGYQVLLRDEKQKTSF